MDKTCSSDILAWIWTARVSYLPSQRTYKLHREWHVRQAHTLVLNRTTKSLFISSSDQCAPVTPQRQIHAIKTTINASTCSNHQLLQIQLTFLVIYMDIPWIMDGLHFFKKNLQSFFKYHRLHKLSCKANLWNSTSFSLLRNKRAGCNPSFINCSRRKSPQTIQTLILSNNFCYAHFSFPILCWILLLGLKGIKLHCSIGFVVITFLLLPVPNTFYFMILIYFFAGDWRKEETVTTD